MTIQPTLQPYSRIIRTVESHTVGEPTRVVYDGFPPLPGDTMMAKKEYLTAHYDHLRSALMLEPRGHRDMFGALLTEPCNPEADFGIIFMDSGGYLNMCGHGSIGAATVIVETGMKPAVEPVTQVVLDTPSGLIRAEVRVEQGRAKEVSIRNVPSFLYLENGSVQTGIGQVPFDVSFGGSFFALVDADRLGIRLEPENAGYLESLGMEILKNIRKTLPVRHPALDISSVDLVEFYSYLSDSPRKMHNCVVFGDGQIDRSPCGTGTSAKLAALYARGQLKLGEEFLCESITGSVFRGEAVAEAQVGPYPAIIPRITGSARITGLNQWILDENDPQVYGFLLGSHK